MDSIIEKVRAKNIWNIPVVDNGKYKGFISKSSLLSAYQEVFDELFLNNFFKLNFEIFF